jgi:hypothetical protein
MSTAPVTANWSFKTVSKLISVAPFNPKMCKKPQFDSIAVVSQSMGENTSASLRSSGFYELTVSYEKRSTVLIASERLPKREPIEIS